MGPELFADRIERGQVEERRLEMDGVALRGYGYEGGRPAAQLGHAVVGDRVDALLRFSSPRRYEGLHQACRLHAPQLRVDLALRGRPQKPDGPLEMPHQVIAS